MAHPRARPALGARAARRLRDRLGFLVVTSDGLNDYQGRPLGTDFSNIYAAGTYVLDGKAAAPFDWPAQHAREQAIFGDEDAVLRLALSAVFPVRRRPARADALRAGARGVAGRDAGCSISARCWLILRASAPTRCALKPRALDAPAVAAARARLPGRVRQHRPRPQRLSHRGADRRRHWSCWTARPILAGVLFGLMAYKPQFGVMIPLVLVATGRWRAFLRPPSRWRRWRSRRIAFGPRNLARVLRLVAISPASRCSNMAAPAGTRSRAYSPWCGCGAAACRSPTRRRAR